MFSPDTVPARSSDVGASADGDTESNTEGRPPNISLPKGGGAIQNIGEKFSVDSTTGTGSFEIKLPLSHSRGKALPGLSLVYDTGNGNGFCGLGWTLTLRTISRKTDKGIPKYHLTEGGDDTDVFMLGDEDLVPLYRRNSDGTTALDAKGKPILDQAVRDGFIIRIYKPRVDSSFERVEHWSAVGAVNQTHWRTISIENITTIYGNSESSRISHPDANEKIYSWLAAEIHDTEGNCTAFAYKAEDSAQVPLSLSESNRVDKARAANRYLKTVQYGNRTPSRHATDWTVISPFTLPDSQWMFSLVLDYGEHDLEMPSVTEIADWKCRKDPFSTRRPGFELRTYRLCHRILMFHRFSSLLVPEQLVWAIELSYDENPSLSLLTRATHAGYLYDRDSQQYRTKRLPPVEFSYSSLPVQEELSHLTVEQLDRGSFEDWPVISDQVACQWLDLYGEGLPGLFAEIGGEWFYKPNLSSSGVDGKIVPHFGSAEPVFKHPGSKFKDGRSQFVSLNANGSLDILESSRGMWGFYGRTPNGEWDTYQYMSTFPNIDIKRPEVKLVDLTGDGHADILVANDEVFTWFKSLGYAGFAEGSTIPKELDERYGPRTVFTDPEDTIYLADMTGDGLSDLLRVRNGHISYWPNLGYGRFGGNISMENSPWMDIADQFNQNNVIIADIDGSGSSDVIYQRPDGTDIYLNQAGNGFRDRIQLSHFPGLDRSSSVQAIDLMGTGTVCLVWGTNLPPHPSLGVKYLDILKGTKPYLLTKVNNNMGGETNISYCPSTAYYIADKSAGKEWSTKIPFPVYCVKKTKTLDHISECQFTSLFSYHEGYYDGGEREFRGFGFVEHWDYEEFTLGSSAPTSKITEFVWKVPPIHTKTWYATGAFDSRKKLDENMLRDSFLISDSLHSRDSWLHLASDVAGIGLSALREAHRSTKGKQLRQEVYSADKSSAADLPHLLTESTYAVQVLQSDDSEHQHGICSIHSRENITYNYERTLEDPRVSHDFNLQVDAYGNSTKKLQVVYGRATGQSLLTGADRAIQERTLISYIENDFTNAISDSSNHSAPMPAATRIYEVSSIPLTGGSKYTWETFAENDFEVFHSLDEIAFEKKNFTNLPAKRLYSHTRTFYRSNNLSRVLPFGQIESLLIPVENYTLALTRGLVLDTYRRQRDDGTFEELFPDASKIFKGTGPDKGGYIDLDGDGSWWAPSGKSFFIKDSASSASQELEEAKTHFFQKKRFRDAFGQESFVDYDTDYFLVTQSEDVLNNVSKSLIDYRTLQPYQVVDINGNRAECKYDEFGKVAGIAMKGKESDNIGDNLNTFQPTITQEQMQQFVTDPTGPIAAVLLGQATTRIIENNNSFSFGGDENRKQPVFRATIGRRTHVNDDLEFPAKFHVDLAYFDGFGQEIQKKSQSDGASNDSTESSWIVSGWVVLNNKGKPAKKYEPFFDSTHSFTFDNRVGVCSTIFYDPLDRIVGFLNPNKTWSKAIYTPWLHTVFDENDTVLMDIETDPHLGSFVSGIRKEDYSPSWYESRASNQLGVGEQKAALKTAAHADTPRAVHLDPLNRPFVTVIDNGAEKFMTTTLLDITGNVISVRDATGRTAEMNVFDLLANIIRKSCMDAGTRWTALDISKKAIYQWDNLGRQFRSVYDRLRRMSQIFVLMPGGTEVQVQETIYGDTELGSELQNIRGQVAHIYDQAGKESYTYDFKGSLITVKRQFSREYKTVLDHQNTVELQEEVFETRNRYDALNCLREQTLPDKTVQRYSYNQSNQLSKIESRILGDSSWTTHAENMSYQARGQRESIQYGNGAITAFTYDSNTFRLARQLTSRNGAVIQDLNDFHDPVGNIAYTQDNAQQTLFFRNQVVGSENEYTYDALYRLISATGREHLSQSSAMRNGPTAGFNAFLNTDIPADGSAVSRYTESYSYDNAGNITSIRHASDSAQQPGWTREYLYQEPSKIDSNVFGNRLSSTVIGNEMTAYRYDKHGNITLPHLSRMDWDHRNLLHATSTQNTSEGRTPETTYYVYDSAGNRVRKVTERFSESGGDATKKKARMYVGAYEVYREYENDGNVIRLERTTHRNGHGDLPPVSTTEFRTIGSEANDPPQMTKYSLGNVLQSVSIELDEDSRILSYEEYTPFGATSYRAVVSRYLGYKRYRFTGKENDEESGLYYHGARYYASWLGRWTSPDPALCHNDKWNGHLEKPPEKGKGETLGKFTTHCSPYAYVNNRPTIACDPDGRDAFFIYDETTVTHASILLVDNKTGVTTEYGFYPRFTLSYQDEKEYSKPVRIAEQILAGIHSGVGLGDGEVRTKHLPNTSVPANGKLDAATISKVLQTTYTKTGYLTGTMAVIHFQTDKIAEMAQAAEAWKAEINKDSYKSVVTNGYSLLWRNCADFVRVLLKHDPAIMLPMKLLPIESPTSLHRALLDDHGKNAYLVTGDGKGGSTVWRKSRLGGYTLRLELPKD